MNKEEIESKLLYGYEYWTTEVPRLAQHISDIWGRSVEELFYSDLSGFRNWIDDEVCEAEDLMVEELPVKKCVRIMMFYGFMKSAREKIKLVENALGMEGHKFQN